MQLSCLKVNCNSCPPTKAWEQKEATGTTPTSSFALEQLCVTRHSWHFGPQCGTQIFPLILHFSISQYRNCYIGTSMHISLQHVQKSQFSFQDDWQTPNPFTCWKLKWNARQQAPPWAERTNGMASWIQDTVSPLRAHAGQELDSKSCHFRGTNRARDLCL